MILTLAGLRRSGESWPVTRVAAMQEATPETLYGRTILSQQFNLYKLARIRLRRPSILALGSSRALQIRGVLFDTLQASYYNAGGLIQGIADLEELASGLDSLGVALPNTVFLVVDPWWFRRSERSRESWVHDGGEADVAGDLTQQLAVVGEVVRRPELIDRLQLRAGDFTPAGVPGVGTAPLATGAGYRSDGSYRASQWALERRATTGTNGKDRVIELVRRGAERFDWSSGWDPEMVDRFREAIVALRRRNVDVRCILAPFTEDVRRVAASRPDQRRWWDRFWGEFTDSLPAWGCPVTAAATPEDLGLDKRYMLDGHHPSEVLMARLVRDALRMDEASASIVANIDSLLAAPATRPWAFDAPSAPGGH